MTKKLKKLKRFATASFAVWPFDPERDSEKIHNRIVIIGLNPSAKIKFGQNFHGGRRDGWYKEGFSRPLFRGSYMTDLISHFEPKAKVVEKKWKKDGEFKRKNIKNLEKQFKILGIKKSTPILCIGQNTGRTFSSTFPEYKVFPINHPNSSSYRMPKNNREVFLENLRKTGKKMRPYVRRGSAW